MKALIVDDEMDICILLMKILKGMNIKTSFANSIKEGKLSFLEVHPDIVFLDINLTDGNSINSIKHFKPDNKNKLVMITAVELAEDKIMAFNEGADAFINKPFTSQQIIDLMNNFISNSNIDHAHINY